MGQSRIKIYSAIWTILSPDQCFLSSNGSHVDQKIALFVAYFVDLTNFDFN
jgi:hypothetical protein